jgi:2-succinyl-5-enolpyruvyl-6-hydroxy-3-cyclohexene-1-carboxylate synthase
LWEAPIIGALLEAAPENGILFSGNSMSIRDFDTFSGACDKPVRLLANRGANGIDGSIATILGMAARSGRTTLAMIGDVAFSHDMGSLQIANDLDVLMVALNNGGGAIFDYQEAARTAEYQDFLCPPKIDIALAAGACGWAHWRAETLGAFTGALRQALSVKGCRVIEAVIDRHASVARHQAFWNEVSDLSVTMDDAAILK